uniref:Uncharacterized protein n=1 Tax=Strix occidentalis caurina TaxID=311401 RepID=A0A8D0KXM5_STROC
MLSRLLKEHQARQSERRELQGEPAPRPHGDRPRPARREGRPDWRRELPLTAGGRAGGYPIGWRRCPSRAVVRGEPWRFKGGGVWPSGWGVTSPPRT